jgi:hypothetical protein
MLPAAVRHCCCETLLWRRADPTHRSNYNTLASSSALDRTISSAQAFLAGVFPPLAADAPAGEQVGLHVL